MLSVYKSHEEGLRTLSLETLEDGCWVHSVHPTAEEIAEVAKKVGVPEEYFRFAFEEDGCPRVLRSAGCLLVIVSVPVFRGQDRYDTIPLSVILTSNCTITVTRELTSVLPKGGEAGLGFDTTKSVHFFFQLLYQAGNTFLRQINSIRKRTDEIEMKLRRSTTNEEVYRLLDLEKGLTYFTAALRANDIVLDNIVRMRASPQFRRWLPMNEEDEDILESVIIENKRALALVQTYGSILSSMMDAFSSVIANNLNHIMKFLAGITILVSIPTMISSFWSMSMVVPLRETEIGFYLVVMLSLLSSALAGLFLRKKRML